MKTREDLKTDYYLQTGEEWLNSQNEPDIDYVQWLEDKILSSLKSMRDEKEEKLPMTKEEIAKEVFYKYEKSFLFCKDRDAIIEAMEEYAGQFQSSPQPQPGRGAELKSTDSVIVGPTDRISHEQVRNYFDDQGVGEGTNITLHMARCMVYDFANDIVLSQLKTVNLKDELVKFCDLIGYDYKDNDNLEEFLHEAREGKDEYSVVRENLMTREGYAPYCGFSVPLTPSEGGCTNPRTVFNGNQFVCPECGWTSQYPDDFIKRYKEKWGI